MKKLSILSMLLLFISMGNIQAQTVKEESRKQKKAEQELLDQMFFDEAKQGSGSLQYSDQRSQRSRRHYCQREYIRI